VDIADDPALVPCFEISRVLMKLPVSVAGPGITKGISITRPRAPVMNATGPGLEVWEPATFIFFISDVTTPGIT